MVHRDALLAAQERILALERELASLRAQDHEPVPVTVARLEAEKRALEAERTRLRVERERLVDDVAKLRSALAKAEEEAGRAKREVKDALAIRDGLRQQAIAEAARAGALRRGASEAPPPPRPEPPPPRKRGRSSRGQRRADARAEGVAPAEERVTLRPRAGEAHELVALDAHNRALRPATESKERPGAGVACPSCVARGERVEMVVWPSGLGFAGGVGVACMRCGAVGLKRSG